MNEEMKNRFEVIRGMFMMIDSMYGFKNSDYGSGMTHGIISTLRALGLGQEFEEYLQELKKEGSDGKQRQDSSVLSDRVE